MDLTGDKVFIRFLEEKDAESLLDLYARNRDFFQKYSPAFEDESFTLEAKRELISDAAQQREEDKNYTFGIFSKETGELVGDVALSKIARGSRQKCLIGYLLDYRSNGKGYATEAVALAKEFAFHELKLHRIEAGVMLDNIGSMRVLEKAGFHKEGIEQKGVKINGQWEDHQIFAVVSDNN